MSNGNKRLRELAKEPVTRLLWALSVVVVGVVMLSCGAPVVNLVVSAPASVVSGAPFSLTVTAMVNGKQDTIFNSPVHFSSSDSAAILPIDYAFSSAPAGSHTFSGVTLMTAGNQSIRVTDIIAPSIKGIANITVSAATDVR